jgi:hypothetical protein
MAALTRDEARHLDRVRALSCVVCELIGQEAAPGSHAHHPREGAGMGQKSGHWLAIALCPDHHQGPLGIHGLGTQRFERMYGTTELELSNRTLARLYGGFDD